MHAAASVIAPSADAAAAVPSGASGHGCLHLSYPTTIAALLQAGGTETLESGGVTIKFKPPPAQRKQGPAAQVQRGGAARGIDPDEAVPGVEIRMPRRPPPRQASDAHETALASRDAAAAALEEPVGYPGSRAAGQGLAAEPMAATMPSSGQQPGGDSLSRAPSGMPPPWQQQQQTQQQQAPPGVQQQYSGVAGPVQQPWGMPAAPAPGLAAGWGPGMPPPPMPQHGPPEWSGMAPAAPWSMPPPFAAPPPHWPPPPMAAAGGPPAGPPWLHQVHGPPATASAGFGMPLPLPAPAGYGMPPLPVQHPWAAGAGAFGPGHYVPAMPTLSVLPPNRPFMGPVFETTSVLAAGLNGSRQVNNAVPVACCSLEAC